MQSNIALHKHYNARKPSRNFSNITKPLRYIPNTSVGIYVMPMWFSQSNITTLRTMELLQYNNSSNEHYRYKSQWNYKLNQYYTYFIT